MLLFTIFLTDCKKADNPIKFPEGTVPDSIINLANINSPYDDYNVALYQLNASMPIIFSSNRKSSGNQFDLEQATISSTFDQTNGIFGLSSVMTTDPFLGKLISKAQTPGNDFGPYRFYSSIDGYEYLVLSSVTSAGDLDLSYLKNIPAGGPSLPAVEGPFPLKLLNTSSDDAYISFDSNFDSIYFTSNKNGNFDIFLKKKPPEKEIASWFNLDYQASTKTDSINTSSDDKCPFIFRNILVFTSNRPGGFGGFDLYYSVFRKGNWSSPVNLGPEINTSSNEYRPVIGSLPDYSNQFIMFSSDRPGGKGGFDIYFTGYKFPK